MAHLIDIILHLDQHLVQWMAYFGPWIYVIMFLVIFCETGLVVTPFLPGDSLLFALGALTTVEGGLNLWILLSSLTIAGILGDTVNYHIGKYLGPKVFEIDSRFFKKQYLIDTQNFYEKWGAFTIVAARFAPIVRTFAPFVAGIGSMKYKKFISYNVIGAILWVFIFILAGHFFGNLPIVKRNFHIVIFGVIGVSLIPVIWPMISSRLKKKAA
ncbi:DedA family protein [Bdellovibrio sp. SKB1291214]|uniref:DedA family protein n=1 Tax=Bdellovibrio sp. SKB1291214 TaxID=1732569 RepID=UPI000B51C7FE|nr:DedA family protein [Bdellovibrio sp. SKB1291214]UYL10480.1 DedA family protein [Bdellovibrio sp. SKB1291214]